MAAAEEAAPPQIGLLWRDSSDGGGDDLEKNSLALVIKMIYLAALISLCVR